MIELDMALTCVNKQPLPGNDVAPALDEGGSYTLKSIHICDCTQAHFDVGLTLKYNYVRCYQCKKELPKTMGLDSRLIHWCHPSRFKETNYGDPKPTST